MNSDIEIGKRIRQRMLDMGLIGETLAPLLGCSPGHLSRVMNGKAGSLTLVKARDWARVLGVTPQWLLEGEAPEVEEAHRRLTSDREIAAALIKLASWFHTATEREREMFRHNLRLWSEQLSRRDTRIRTWTAKDVVEMERSTSANLPSWGAPPSLN